MPIDTSTVFKSPDSYLNKLAPLYGDVYSLSVPLAAYRVHSHNAWAQSGDKLKPDSILRTTQLDIALDSEFERRAAAQGYAIGTPLIPVPPQLEARILVRRLLPEQSSHLANAPWHQVAATIFRCSAAAPNTGPLGKLLWMFWLLFLLSAPKALVRSMFRSGRSQSRRPWVFRWIVGLSRRS
jgi:hypothetical protein